jgi:hypothetical protein
MRTMGSDQWDGQTFSGALDAAARNMPIEPRWCFMKVR